MKNLKFKDTSVLTRNGKNKQSVSDNFIEGIRPDASKVIIYDNHPTRSQIVTSRKFKIALITAYSSLMIIFGLVVYTAIILDPKFPF